MIIKANITARETMDLLVSIGFSERPTDYGAKDSPPKGRRCQSASQSDDFRQKSYEIGRGAYSAHQPPVGCSTVGQLWLFAGGSSPGATVENAYRLIGAMSHMQGVTDRQGLTTTIPAAIAWIERRTTY